MPRSARRVHPRRPAKRSSSRSASSSAVACQDAIDVLERALEDLRGSGVRCRTLPRGSRTRGPTRSISAFEQLERADRASRPDGVALGRSLRARRALPCGSAWSSGAGSTWPGRWSAPTTREERAYVQAAPARGPRARAQARAIARTSAGRSGGDRGERSGHPNRSGVQVDGGWRTVVVFFTRRSPRRHQDCAPRAAGCGGGAGWSR